jgi:intermediate peptidase
LPSGDSDNEWNQIDKILNGLTKLCAHLFNLDFSILLFKSNMTALSVLDSSSKAPVGLIILDLLEAPYKRIGPSNFTLFGSKLFELSTKALGYHKSRQLPAIYLSCNIKDRNSLDFSEIQSLFHEFGHALHGVMSTTRYQSLSGTRCSLDFAEYPSMLMEKIAGIWDVYRFMGAPNSVRCEFEQLMSEANVADRSRTQQIIAHTDLMLHTHPNPKAWILENDRCGWVRKIEHFNTYGATYYSYLLADIFASMTLDAAVKDPGLFQRLRAALLSKGGTADPIIVLSDLGIDLKFI